MLKDISRERMAAMWVATVIVMAAFSVVLGINLTVNNGELWLVACLVPPAVILLVWQGPPPATVAELLYSVEKPSKGIRS